MTLKTPRPEKYKIILSPHVFDAIREVISILHKNGTFSDDSKRSLCEFSWLQANKYLLRLLAKTFLQSKPLSPPMFTAHD